MPGAGPRPAPGAMRTHALGARPAPARRIGAFGGGQASLTDTPDVGLTVARGWARPTRIPGASLAPVPGAGRGTAQSAVAHGAKSFAGTETFAGLGAFADTETRVSRGTRVSAGTVGRTKPRACVFRETPVSGKTPLGAGTYVSPATFAGAWTCTNPKRTCTNPKTSMRAGAFGRMRCRKRPRLASPRLNPFPIPIPTTDGEAW
ncbi:hypothetical protein GCM10010486_06730 [Nonomuraea roseoviolacea subsp. carminata]